MILHFYLTLYYIISDIINYIFILDRKADTPCLNANGHVFFLLRSSSLKRHTPERTHEYHTSVSSPPVMVFSGRSAV